VRSPNDNSGMTDIEEPIVTDTQAGDGIQLANTPVHFAAGGGARTIGDFTWCVLGRQPARQF